MSYPYPPRGPGDQQPAGGWGGTPPAGGYGPSGPDWQQRGQGRFDDDCGATVWGATLKSALRTYGCTQAVRAVYVSSDQRWAGELAIFKAGKAFLFTRNASG